ncbi:DASH complex subunit Duo1-domain-containing protein [Chaetomium tenue]|uniref:DASH complex subunit Duo1-domain-containing protein n=1 Tax=Chaetomium tenue TaxID=1854479 RepID=A0ACB7NXQ5_9PEZI|nr:DASH complex subunit Duo1-domain-containing protein [Chaetomium globosum]
MADDFDSSDHEDTFASPPNPVAGRSKTPTNQNSRFDTDESREAALQKELDGVRKINEVIEGVIGTLERAKGNMGVCWITGHSVCMHALTSFLAIQTVSKTVDNASTLLNTWTRILSQTEHNQRLLLNPEWKGSTQDVADMEHEALSKQQEAERRAAEAEQRREEIQRRAEEEERRRAAGTPSSLSRGVSRGVTRGRVRGATRGVTRGATRGVTRGAAASSSSTAYGADTTSSSVASSRNTSGIGRGGFGYTRGSQSRGVR